MTSQNMECILDGVFFTGDRPRWIIATDKGGLGVVPSGHTVVYAFTACSLWESKGDFLLYSDEGRVTLLEWALEVQLDSCLPYRSWPLPHYRARFASYDEDGSIIWEPDGNGVSFLYADCSTLELISPERWVTMDGYEFASDEFVDALTCVSLETTSTESGSKNCIAVETTINRGEDLAVKGAVCYVSPSTMLFGRFIFEAVEVVSDANWTPNRWYKLKLRVRDDAKGPATAMCGINGYLVSSMGRKANRLLCMQRCVNNPCRIFVRALDLDERLVGVCVTSLCSMENLLLIGDAAKSVWLVAFQEDPYKLVTLAKVLRVDDKEFKIKHSNKTSSPEWNESLDFSASAHMSRLCLSIYDHKTRGKDKLLAEGEVDRHIQVGRSTVAEVTVELQGGGLAHLRLEFDAENNPLARHASVASLERSQLPASSSRFSIRGRRPGFNENN
ncbi:CPSF A subunit region-domain-containing protein [Suillus discolor]|uniref:CPSF A subunit region-domain-containing protein n=1 Tax=Suillus discolor TaxID=1912936 RepID=A0A9P7EU68_9AGAM|nr:CPSF A subunit region-domain-containing protein [Suillus discolor]KAG2088396.1 CPSF A subunit region-domain-containing protein [Suillus discolor]